MAADIVGYSRLMDADEAGTYAALRAALSEVVDPAIADHHGRIVKHTGDGFLAEFPTVQDVMECALIIQNEIGRRGANVPEETRLQFRIGINLGDIIIADDGDIFGDGVNVAARLESMASPGGICISGPVYESVRKKIDLVLQDLGEKAVKNISTKVRAYEVRLDGDIGGPIARDKRHPSNRMPAAVAATIMAGLLFIGGMAWWQPWSTLMETLTGTRTGQSLSTKPSIAVLPFDNLSNDKEQAYFSDGITEDIITDLARISGLFVVARNSSFNYRGKSVDITDVARDLDVRHVLKGSVRRSGDQLRITVQLIDTSSGNHIWAERYDRKANDVFAIQDEISAKVVAELAITLKADEQERLYRQHTNNLAAYDAFLRARRILRLPKKELVSKAQTLFEEVISLDPKFAGGYAGLSFAHAIRVRHGLSATPKMDIEQALELARRAVALDDTFGWSYLALGGAHLISGAHDKSVSIMREAVRVQPNDADGHLFLGNYLHWSGRGPEAIDSIETAMRLNPKPRSGRQPAFLAQAYFTAGQYEQTIAVLEPYYEALTHRATASLAFLAAAYVATEQNEQARAAMAKFLAKHPSLRASSYKHPRLYKRKEDQQRYLGLLRKAGMPE